MFISYLRSLYRNILKNRFYTILNVIGLFLGLTTAILILLFVQDELSYDKYHKNHK